MPRHGMSHASSRAVCEASVFHCSAPEHGLVHGKAEVYDARLLLGASVSQAKQRGSNMELVVGEDTGKQFAVRLRGARCGTLDDDFENGKQEQQIRKRGRGIKQTRGT